MHQKKISIIIRTLNEAKYLRECLEAIKRQTIGCCYEIIVVDSQSEDNTCNIAREFNCKIIEIARSNFTYGRALNLGINHSSGSVMVLISAHCVPVGTGWLAALCKPIFDNQAVYTYGRQVGRVNCNKSSECRDMSNQFPEHGLPEDIVFSVNNANAALAVNVWKKQKFNELLPGREDFDLAQRIIKDGDSLSYIPSAVVEHIHTENWQQIKQRFYREVCAELRISNVGRDRDRNLLLSMFEKVYHDITFQSVKLRDLNNILIYRTAEYSGRKKAIEGDQFR